MDNRFIEQCPHSVTQNRKQIIAMLPDLVAKGYRYMARDHGSGHINLFSCKPEKFAEVHGFWGYKDADLNNEKSIMAYPIKNDDLIEIRWQNRSPVRISEWLKDQQ